MYNKNSPTIITTKSKTCHKTNQTHTDTQQTEIESITSTPANKKLVKINSSSARIGFMPNYQHKEKDCSYMQ